MMDHCSCPALFSFQSLHRLFLFINVTGSHALCDCICRTLSRHLLSVCTERILCCFSAPLPSHIPQVTVPPPKNADGTGGTGADVQKTILHSVFGVAAPGQMVALMGMRFTYCQYMFVLYCYRY